MDHTIAFYQACIKQLLSEYEALQTEDSRVELVFDDERERYVVMRVGWFHHKRIHHCLVHIDLCDHTIIIQANNTEDQLDDDLVDLGIPRENICLGLLPPDVQEYVVQQRRERQQSLQSIFHNQPGEQRQATLQYA
ncbi:XisI protein-like protein [Candidatus Vecturithrix granuli]|uniref:XisI protein-like protein n=1 Tax=Vecturithrix granuli TaxID=1499967 RepID=A0A081C5P3_VECG1|nr:XisI protein-like protein [Candidatus Vecturithrix granuli]